MAKQTINIGTSANDRTGDPLRIAFTKVNQNFTEVYTNIANTISLIPDLGNFKISQNILGTEGANTSTWGATGIGIDPGGESNAGIFIPSVSAQTTGAALQIYNNSIGGGPIQLMTQEGSWSFTANGHISFPDGSVQYTAYTGGDLNIWIQDFISASDVIAPDSIIPGAGSVEYDADGNIIAVFSVVDTGNTTSGTLVAKFDTFGAKQWEVIFQGSQYTDGWGLAVDSTNNWGYVAGRSSGIGGYDKSLITKINLTNGTVLWSKILDYGYASNSPVVDIATDGNVIIVGYADNNTDNYITVSKLGTDGSYIWGKSLNSYGDEEAYGMGVGPSGEIIVVGTEQQFLAPNAANGLYAAPGSNANWTANTTINLLNNFEFDVSFTDGVPTFTNIIDRIGNRTIEETITTIPGDQLGGTTPEDDMSVGVDSVSTNSGQSNKVLVAKYAANGTLTWQKSIEIDNGWNCSGADADIDSDGNIYVCGNFNNPDTENQVMFIFKLNSAGVGQWTRKVIGNCNDSATSIVVGPDDHLYLSGVTGNNPTEDFSLVIAKYNRDGTVAWQRLLDNITSWTFGGNWWFNTGGGSNIAVKEGYVAVSGGFADPFGTTPRAIVTQFDTDGTVFTTGNYNFKNATFSGLLTSAPTIIDDIRADLLIEFGINNFDPDYSTNFSILEGTLHAPGGNSVDIGDITFSANKIIGSGADSGDNNNYDTIRLVPDASLYNNDQYLIIDPTGGNPGHIHIRAGGTQDDSTANLFLGGEQTNIMVADVSHTITIKTWDGDASNFNWVFGSDGSITLPTLTVPISDNSNPNGTGQTLKFSDPSQQAIIYGPTSTSGIPNAERVIIQGAPGYTGTAGEGGDVYLWAGPGGSSNGNGGDIKIRAGLGNGSGGGGYLNFQAGDSSTGPGGYINIESGSSSTNQGGSIEINARSGGDINLYTGQSGTIGLNTEDGSLTLDVNIPQVGTKQIIATNYDGQLGGWGSTALAIAYDPNIITAYPIGSTITFSNGDVRTITGWDDYGPLYIDLFWDTPTTSNPLFPIILKTANYAAEVPAATSITMIPNIGSPQRWDFKADGSTTLPGSIIKSTVSNTGPLVADLGYGRAATVTATPSNNTNLNIGTVAGIAMGAGFTLTVTVAENGDISAIVTDSNQNQLVGDTSTILGGGALGGTSPADDITFTVATLTDIIVRTPITLTKTINKLTAGAYSLADGIEGQIMYLVPQTGITDTVNVNVLVSNFRTSTGTGTNGDLYPFREWILTDTVNRDLCTLIFTDGAWQQNGGLWDY